jgi:hypothetical protein
MLSNTPCRKTVKRIFGKLGKDSRNTRKRYGNQLFWKVLIQDPILFGSRFFFWANSELEGRRSAPLHRNAANSDRTIQYSCDYYIATEE